MCHDANNIGRCVNRLYDSDYFSDSNHPNFTGADVVWSRLPEFAKGFSNKEKRKQQNLTGKRVVEGRARIFESSLK